MTREEKKARKRLKKREKRSFRQAMAMELREHRSSFIVFAVLRAFIRAQLDSGEAED